MKIKSLLLGSAAALVAVSGARAADAVVIPEPEAVEYVRVCDAAGTGYFYIPGTETCLKIGGYVRYQVGFEGYSDEVSEGAVWSTTKSDLQVSSWTDSEYGAITTYFEYVASSAGTSDIGVAIDSMYLSVGGLKMGYFGGFLDNGINGETDNNGLKSKFDQIQYSGSSGGFKYGVSIDALTDYGNFWGHGDGLKAGFEAMVGFTVGGIDATLTGYYDLNYEEGGIVARASAAVGPGTLQGRFTWNSGYSTYNNYTLEGEYVDWVAEVSYAAKVSDKLTLTPGFSYAHGSGDDNLWVAGLTADYALTKTLAAKASVQYVDFNDDWFGVDDYHGFKGFVRLQASF